MEKFLTPLSDKRRKKLDQRQVEKDEKDVETRRYRTRQQRDRDRVLYSSAFQRLAYVTQVTASESGHTFHNRLSHSLKVAQVGRRNAERLQKLVKAKAISGRAAELVSSVDPDCVEASCLAHDLGHPPFGHIAEDVLHEQACVHVVDGFEGNAQSFRVVTRLAVRADGAGLNLTRETLDGLLKYPWRHWPTDSTPGAVRERKWGYYEQDKAAFEFAREDWPDETKDSLPERCFAAELMEWADDLTFAVHDVDDFFRAGLVPLDRLAEPGGAEGKRFRALLQDAKDARPDAFPKYEIDELVAAASSVIARSTAPLEPYQHTVNARAAMREFGSLLITRYLEAFSVCDDLASGKVKLTIDEPAFCELTALKMLVVAYVVRRPGLAVVQHGQQRIMRDLFEWYYEASSPTKEGDRRLFPPSARERLDASSGDASDRARVVVDLLAGLTETAALQLHRRLSGGWDAPTLDATALIG